MVRNEVAGSGLGVTSWYINSVERDESQIVRSRASTDLSAVPSTVAPLSKSKNEGSVESATGSSSTSW